MKHRIVVTIEPETREEAVAFYREVCALLHAEGYDPNECVEFEYERVSWERVAVSADD